MSHNKQTKASDTLQKMHDASLLMGVTQYHAEKRAERVAATALARLRAASLVMSLKHRGGESKSDTALEKAGRRDFRRPTRAELKRGIPRNFTVQEVPRKTGSHVDKYYYSPTGKKYRSVPEVLRSLDDSSSSSESYSASDSEDEMMCEDDDDITQYTITLRLEVNDKPVPARRYLPSATVAQVLEDVSLPDGTFFYQGAGRSKTARLQCAIEDIAPNGVYEVSIRDRPGMYTFVFDFSKYK